MDKTILKGLSKDAYWIPVELQILKQNNQEEGFESAWFSFWASVWLQFQFCFYSTPGHCNNSQSKASRQNKTKQTIFPFCTYSALKRKGYEVCTIKSQLFLPSDYHWSFQSQHHEELKDFENWVYYRVSFKTMLITFLYALLSPNYSLE